MLTALRLGNFKAFADTQRIPIKPLTLIFGPNSSGKSSILHGLLLAQHAIEKGELDVHIPKGGGTSVDLGGFRQYIHRGATKNTVEWGVDFEVEKLTGRLKQLLAPCKQVSVTVQIGLQFEEKKALYSVGADKTAEYATGEMVAVGDPFIRRYEVAVDGQTVFSMSRRTIRWMGAFAAGNGLQYRTGFMDTKLQMDSLNREHPLMQSLLKAIVEGYTTTNLGENDLPGIRETIDALVPNFTAKGNKLLPSEIAVERRDSGFRPEPESSSPEAPVDARARELAALGSKMIPVGKGNRAEALAAAVGFHLPRILNDLAQGLHSAANTALTKVEYLGPLRPVDFNEASDARHVLSRDERVRARVNRWLGDEREMSTPYELRMRHLLTIDDLDKDFTDTIRHLENTYTTQQNELSLDLFGEVYSSLEKLKKYEPSLSRVQELSLFDKRTNTFVSFNAVGKGITQVLPVLVAAFSSRNTLLAIEEPETHLHPALQARLGDAFIESALGQSQNILLLETHSEHLILRILRRIRETNRSKHENLFAVRPEHVCLLYVDPAQPGSAVKELRVDERGRLIDRCPGGFFEEDFAELF